MLKLMDKKIFTFLRLRFLSLDLSQLEHFVGATNSSPVIRHWGGRGLVTHCCVLAGMLLYYRCWSRRQKKTWRRMRMRPWRRKIKTRNTTGIMEVSLTSLFNFLIIPQQTLFMGVYCFMLSVCVCVRLSVKKKDKDKNTSWIMEVSLTALFNFLITFKHKVSYWDQSIFGIMTWNTTGIMESQGFSLASAIGHSPKIVPDVREFAVQFGQFVRDDFQKRILYSNE